MRCCAEVSEANLESPVAQGYAKDMSTAANIREKLARELFQSFCVRLSSGDKYVISSPDLVVVMKSEMFIAKPNSDDHVFVPLLHVAAVESQNGGNGNGSAGTRRRKRK